MIFGDHGIVHMLRVIVLVGLFQSKASLSEVLYSNPGPIVPSKGSVLTHIDIGDTMHFEMDVVVHSWPSGNANIIHCGSADSVRQPGVWIHPNSASTLGFNVYWQPESAVKTGEAMELEETYRLVMDMTQGLFKVTVNGEVRWDVDDVGTHSTYENMECYVSDPWWDAADVTITNLLITDGATANPTAVTAGPTVAPTAAPTADPRSTRDCSFLAIDDYIQDCSTEVGGHEARIETLETQMQAVMVHLNHLKEDGSPMFLGTGDYTLYALAVTNMLVVLCLGMYCVFVRTASKYGKVAIYETEA